MTKTQQVTKLINEIQDECYSKFEELSKKESYTQKDLSVLVGISAETVYVYKSLELLEESLKALENFSLSEGTE